MPHHRQVGLMPHAAPQTSGPIAACLTTLDKWRGGSCHTLHHRQEGLLPHAAPQTSGPNAACRTTDKWAYCRTTDKWAYCCMPHHSGQMVILPHHRQDGLSPFSLPHCKQVGLTLLATCLWCSNRPTCLWCSLRHEPYMLTFD